MATLTSTLIHAENSELRPKVKDHYRADKMALWLKLIPELLSNGIGNRIPEDDDDEDEDEDEESEGKVKMLMIDVHFLSSA